MTPTFVPSGAAARWLVLALAAIAVGVVPARGQQRTPRLEAVMAGLEWREIGPAVMGGRIADIAVVESNPAIFYVGTATGGLWKTTNHGTSWTPLFDAQPTSSIGAVAVAPSNPNLIWVGTGEPQNRQSSPWGNGVYKSLDGGRTWEHMGLAETRHIGRIVIHPRDPEVVYVAAVGHLWGPNAERGVFKSADGGATWTKVLYVDEHTGAIDLAMDPGDPRTLFAAMYQRRRTNWGFNGGGPGSGIYRTLDGGATWRELTAGLPSGTKGRIGLDVYRRDGNVVYAVVEARPPKRGVYRSTDRGETWEQVSDWNPRPMYFSLIRIDPADPQRIYLGGVQLSASDDAGRTWNRNAARGVHSDHHALWIDPANSNHLVLGSDGGISVSFDRAETWRMYDNLPIGQFYEIGYDMREPYFVCGGLQDNGSWCGPSATWSTRGILNGDWYNIHGGDGFYTQIDPSDHSVVFAESQNGNISRVDVLTGERQSIRPLPRQSAEEEGDDGGYRWNWNTPIHLSHHDAATLYAGANVLLKSTDRGMSWTELSPDLTKRVDRDTLRIMGALPSDSMLSRHDGISNYGTITTIGESPLDPNVIYVGTDDGNLHVTRDGGAGWTDLTARLRGLPAQTYVSRVVPSRHAPGTVYATFDGHTNDDYRPYVYVSRDYGQTWRAIVTGLPEWSVNVLTEHPRTSGLLFVGNEVGVFVSVDGGERWLPLKNNLPTVPVDDIKIQPRDNDLIVGTHGRSIWILDDITSLEQLTPALLAAPAHLFPVRAATLVSRYAPQGWTPGAYAAANPPGGALIRYYLGRSVAAVPTTATNGEATAARAGAAPPTVTLTVLGPGGNAIRLLEGSGTAGLHDIEWDLRYPPPVEVDRDEAEEPGFGGPPRGPRVLPGTYTVRLDAGTSPSATLVVRGDPRIAIDRAALEERQAALMRLHAVGGPLYRAGRAVERLGDQLDDVEDLLGRARGAPAGLGDSVGRLARDVRALARRVSGARRTVQRLAGALERATARPTADQLWQLDRVWSDATAVVADVNAVIAERLPALYTQLDAHGVRPDPGAPIPIPQPPHR